ncbi:hypothetical protein NDU88_005474 [Pleurodeles waltl]|uniref:Uncharacterized protein n=1 Tax=Pleurodeles waltl TaxID=8319 RepID=A0AAV7WBZ6_PLEWA|nr:hypothetical protein NDU88_005474 [Pleurodeles waltl]
MPAPPPAGSNREPSLRDCNRRGVDGSRVLACGGPTGVKRPEGTKQEEGSGTVVGRAARAASQYSIGSKDKRARP